MKMKFISLILSTLLPAFASAYPYAYVQLESMECSLSNSLGFSKVSFDKQSATIHMVTNGFLRSQLTRVWIDERKDVFGSNQIISTVHATMAGQAGLSGDKGISFDLDRMLDKPGTYEVGVGMKLYAVPYIYHPRSPVAIPIPKYWATGKCTIKVVKPTNRP